VAVTLGYGFPAAVRRYGLDVTDAALLGCGLARGGPYRYFGEVQPALDRCADWEARWSDLLDRYHPDVVALLVGRWEVMDRVHDGRWMHVGQPVFDAYLTDELERAVSVLSRRGATVTLLTAPAYHRGERPDGGSWPEDDVARVRRWNELLWEVAARHPGDVGVVDFGGRLSPGGRVVGVIDGVRVRNSDGVHVTPEGGRWLAPWLARELASLRAPSG
jgi:hypothetical protein